MVGWLFVLCIHMVGGAVATLNLRSGICGGALPGGAVACLVICASLGVMGSGELVLIDGVPLPTLLLRSLGVFALSLTASSWCKASFGIAGAGVPLDSLRDVASKLRL